MTTEKNEWESWVPILENEFASQVSNSPAVSDAHGIDHVHRVWQHCKNLGHLMNADLEILLAAAYFHDLGRHHINDKAHGKLSSELAEPILNQIKFPVEKINVALHAIRVHDVTAEGKDRHSIESKILYDADKLDSFGTVGIVRNILVYWGKKPIDYILSDLDSKWKGLSLNETREYATKDYDFTKSFFIQLAHELS